jgi:hypothetical protein
MQQVFKTDPSTNISKCCVVVAGMIDDDSDNKQSGVHVTQKPRTLHFDTSKGEQPFLMSPGFEPWSVPPSVGEFTITLLGARITPSTIIARIHIL